MPRGAEFDNGKPQSDNAMSAGENLIHGAGPKTTDEVTIDHTKKTAPLPEGLSEVNDRNLSGGAAPGHESGKGHAEFKIPEENK